jgi:hypothetical protein
VRYPNPETPESRFWQCNNEVIYDTKGNDGIVGKWPALARPIHLSLIVLFDRDKVEGRFGFVNQVWARE